MNSMATIKNPILEEMVFFTIFHLSKTPSFYLDVFQKYIISEIMALATCYVLSLLNICVHYEFFQNRLNRCCLHF